MLKIVALPQVYAWDTYTGNFMSPDTSSPLKL